MEWDKAKQGDGDLPSGDAATTARAWPTVSNEGVHRPRSDDDPIGSESEQPSGKNDRMAVASIWCSAGGLLFFPAAIVGIIFGFVARSRLKRSEGGEPGGGLANAGIALGCAAIVLAGTLLVVTITSSTGTQSPQRRQAIPRRAASSIVPDATLARQRPHDSARLVIARPRPVRPREALREDEPIWRRGAGFVPRHQRRKRGDRPGGSDRTRHSVR